MSHNTQAVVTSNLTWLSKYAYNNHNIQANGRGARIRWPRIIIRFLDQQKSFADENETKGIMNWK